jgi:voltage-gated sodium channel
VTTFTVLNLFIGIIVDAIATVKEQDESTRHHQPSSKEDIDLIRQDLSTLGDRLEELIKNTERRN